MHAHVRLKNACSYSFQLRCALLALPKLEEQFSEWKSTVNGRAEMRRLREQMEKKRVKRVASHKRRLGGERWLASDEVSSEVVQDRGRKMVIVGTDCVSLYPNLRKVEWEVGYLR